MPSTGIFCFFQIDATFFIIRIVPNVLMFLKEKAYRSRVHHVEINIRYSFETHSTFQVSSHQ